ncbi:succinylglutamate desuccinylase/aspartoacylase family protein [Ornithinibacillus halotolerans]|uniref:Succinylglutamate desuccinylase/Aspartoacylase catalytic domain-containing protein n=1 Tax=Ornithinibacillus halotolerans TaxID=1274357 RepID=A0A916S9Z1_9BACI|nr:M14 family metallopeptidase [Ornithinibacillus halotolerans]GGA91206.1 hypothetical protein GCM10008025_37140 [Ornithinibacillus halotolerans]
MNKIGTAQILPGEKTEGYIQFGSDIDGSPFQIPVLIATGKEDGPVVWVQGCIHGDEFGGAASIIRFFQELNVDSLKGTFIGVPVVNLPSYKDRSRISPLDGANLNRVFPGDPNGTYSLRLADKIQELIINHADYLFDLHSGGIALYCPFFTICKGGDSEAAKKSRWLSERMGTKIVWVTDSTNSVNGTVTDYVMNAGIPTVTVEVGGGVVTEEHEELFKTSIKNGMKALEMLDGDPVEFDEYEVYTKGDFIFSPAGGLFVPACEAGSKLNKGDLIGTIINLHGEVLEEIRCKEDNSFLAATGHRYWPTEMGRLIAETYS